jgi:osmotically-inducible protein OsmY
MAQTLLSLSDVASQAKGALARSRIFDLRRLDVEQEGECVVLRGRVDSFYHKQLAQELVRVAVEGVEVINAISVDYRGERAADELPW